jgi:endonuclease YncB( thermonuclease family)
MLNARRLLRESARGPYVDYPHARLLAAVRLPDGRRLNQELVRAGYA